MCVRAEPTAADRARQSGAASSSKQLSSCTSSCSSCSRDHLVEAFERRPKAAACFCCCDVDFLSTPSLIREEGTPHHALGHAFRTSG